MAPATNVCRSVLPVTIPNRHVHDLKMLFAGTEEQIKIAERIKIAEEVAVPFNLLVIGSMQHLRSAKGVLNGLAEQPAESVAKEFVRNNVAELHCLTFHRIDQANPVDEIT